VSLLLAPPTIEPWPLAAHLASMGEATPWTLIAAPAERIDEIATEIAFQLGGLLDAEVERARATSPAELLGLMRERGVAPLIIQGLDALDGEGWRRVDVNRSRLMRTSPALVMLSEHRLRIVAENAPNLWSWLSGSIWCGALEGEAIGPEA